MPEENNIDKLFKSKIDSLDVKPSEKSRIVIESFLERKQGIDYRKKIFYFRIAVACMVLIILFGGAYYNFLALENNYENKDMNEKIITEKKAPLNNDKNEKQNLTIIDSEDLKNNSASNQEAIISEEASGKVILSENKEFSVPFNKIQDNKIEFASSIIIKKLELTDNDLYFNEVKPLEIYAESESNSSNTNFINSAINIFSLSTEVTEISSDVNKVPFSLALFYSPHYSYCAFTDNTPDNNIDEVNMYNDQEDSEFSYSTGLSLRYKFSDKWSVLAGLTHATVVKSISLLTVYADKNSNNEMYYAYSTSSGIIEIPDESNTAHLGDSLKLDNKGEKTLKFIQFPFLARYSINKNKINWFVNAGPSINVLVQDQARISTGNREEIIYNKTRGLKIVSYGFVIGAGMEYKVNKNLNLVFEPVFRGTFTSITENTSVKNYPYSIGANLGLALEF